MSVVFQSDCFETFAVVGEQEGNAGIELSQAINALRLQAAAVIDIEHGVPLKQQVSDYTLEYQFTNEGVEILALHPVTTED